ncbi:hypothetical protein [Actinotalea solisilvae]|uniref:hypothetical protein n=1 Tax=Actinotalea solisilvae TaxID=2072922 RepID=UPI0018F16946|nr:hypothetical protein [Actinotalea solisilvae]
MRVRPSAAVAVGVAGTLLLAGCTGDPSAAAVVDGRTITRADVEAAQDDLSAGEGVSGGEVLWILTIAPAYIDAATDAGVGVSEDEARAALVDGNEEAGGADGEVADSTVQVARAILSSQALGSLENGDEVLGEVQARVTELDVDVNPRYGELDLAAGTIAPTVAPWIVGTAGTDGTDGAPAEG